MMGLSIGAGPLFLRCIMPVLARCRKAASLLVYSLFCFAASSTTLAQQSQTLGSIIGHVHVARGEAPPQRVLVTIEVRGAAMDSVYTDSQGTFGFHSLSPDPYNVIVNDEHYQPVRISAVILPTSLNPTTFLDITLIPKQPSKETGGLSSKPAGANPDLMDVREYTAKFPKAARKEFDKGLDADRAGKMDEAIRHYQKAVQIDPGFYAAHNNLGSDYLSKSDFAASRKEFEQVVALNQSDATAYFNLSNVCLLMNQVPDAQRFLEEGFRRQPDSALGQFLLGSLDLRAGKMSEAEHALRQAVQLNPVMVQPRLQLVNLYLQQGRKQDAVTELHAFVSAFPDNPFNKQAQQLLQRLEGPAKAAGSAPN
jgi:tetratricopeptide (TPR) repeat protein